MAGAEAITPCPLWVIGRQTIAGQNQRLFGLVQKRTARANTRRSASEEAAKVRYNHGTPTDRLIGGSVDVANSFQLDSMVTENGIAKMRDLSGIDIKPGQMIEFKPGGSHAMFVNLKHPLSKGEHVKGTLIFEHAGTVQIEYGVGGIGAQRGPMDMEHMQHLLVI
jgi:copper(I)-binding protein